MELSGLIFVALALVWAVVLIPKALRHHDELAETRSVDEVSHGARVVARREPAGSREARLVVGPTVSAQRRPPSGEGGTVTRARLHARREAARTAAQRRRRVLGLLLVVSTVIGACSVLGLLAAWAPAVPGALVLAFLVVARVTVRRDARRWDALVAARGTAAVVPDGLAEVTDPAEVTAPAPLVRNEQGLAVVTGLDDTTSIPVVLAELADEQPRDRLWDPLPVTLPTYVSKPRATRSVRTIDLSAGGVASSGHDPQASALVAEAATATGTDEPEQRAVAT